MGAGLAEAGAQIARTTQAGYQQLGAGLAGGIESAVGEYVKYKDIKSSVTASEKAYETLKGVLPKELTASIDAQIESMGKDASISLNDKRAFWDQTKSLLGASVAQAMDMQKLQSQQAAAMARLAEENKLALERQKAELQARSQFEQDRLKNQKEIASYEAILKAGGGKEAPSRSFMLPGGSAFKLGGGVYDK